MIKGPRICPTPVAKAFARFSPSSHLQGSAGAALEGQSAQRGGVSVGNLLIWQIARNGIGQAPAHLVKVQPIRQLPTLTQINKFQVG
ncbi:hypothetical protein ACCS93_35685 [Rhizobium ruizarguesonis]